MTAPDNRTLLASIALGTILAHHSALPTRSNINQARELATFQNILNLDHDLGLGAVEQEGDTPLIARSEPSEATSNVYNLAKPRRQVFWSTPYNKAQSKGCQLHQILLRINQLSPSEYTSRFGDVNNLATNGWTNTPRNIGSGIQNILQSVQGPLSSIGIATGNVQNVNVESMHDGHGTSYTGTATGGRYFEVYNAEQGAIVAYRKYGPAYVSSKITDWNNKPLLALKQWSDAVFLTWLSMTSTDERKNLRCVIRLMVMNEDTQEIVSQALKNDGIASGVPPSWPGHTFSHSNNNGRGLKPFQAILGTPNISGVAWMLINHRDDLDYRTIDSTTVWDKSGMENQDAGFLPCMLVRLGPG